MTQDEQRQLLLEIAHKLTLLATGEDVNVSLPIDHPPGTLKVAPTGVLGQGKVRFWPEPIEVNRIDGTRGMELCWSYALRMSYVKRPDGEPYVPRIYQQGIGEWMIKAAPGPEQWQMYAATVDRWIYPEEWMDQAQIDARLASDEQWAADYRKKYGV
jgi:hypothetical protein